jgi:hypothetical protein
VNECSGLQGLPGPFAGHFGPRQSTTRLKRTEAAPPPAVRRGVVPPSTPPIPGLPPLGRGFK